MAAYGYTAVPGSARLKTRPRPAEGPLLELETLDPAAPAGRWVGEDWLGRTVVRAEAVFVLLDVYDRLALDQEPEEQALYGHLYRLALGEERNFCRVSRRELCARTRLSDRRLGKALAGLVKKGHVRLVERDKRGTLYRVMLPHEVFAEPDRDAVHFPGRDRQAAPAEGLARRPRGAAAHTPVGRGKPKSRSIPYKYDRLLDHSSIGALAASFLAAFGGGRGRSQADLLEEILGRLEEGDSLEQVAEDLAAFGRELPKKTPISELSRFVAKRRVAREDGGGR